MSYNLFLDDERQPKDVHWLPNYPLVEWTVVRNLADFERVVKARGVPLRMSLDHDLHHDHYVVGAGYFQYMPGAYDEFASEGKWTGWHCLSWFYDHCRANGYPEIPEMWYHTLNHVGAENMRQLTLSYLADRARHMPASKPV